jgi:hypothetical protein
MFPYAAIAQAGIGLIQSGISAAKASQLPDDQKYTVGPEMSLAYNMSRRRAEEGYSAEEKAAFEQMLARQGTAAKRMFQNVGMSGAGSAAANIMGVDAMNQFAAQGANIRRQNFGQFANMAGQVQGVQNMEIGRFNQQLNMERQALGQGVQSGIGNIFGGINAGQNFGQTQQAMDIYKNMGQGGGTGGGDAFNPFTSNLPQAPMGTTSGFDQNGFATSNAPQVNPQVGVTGSGVGPAGFYGFNPNFQGGGMGAYGQQPNMGFMPPNLNQPFQGYGMGMFNNPN